MAYNQGGRQDSSGTLKTTISLGRTPAIVHSGPFYLMKEPPEPSELTGASNLIAHHRLSNTYIKLLGKKKNELSAFLHSMTDVNMPFAKTDPESTLKSLCQSRIIGGKEILPMNPTQSIGFRLMPGQLPAQYRLFNQFIHKKHKKHKKKQRSQTHESHTPGEGSGPSDPTVDPALVERNKKKEKKKQKKKDKKDKKDKKRKVHGQSTSGNDE